MASVKRDLDWLVSTNPDSALVVLNELQAQGIPPDSLLQELGITYQDLVTRVQDGQEAAAQARQQQEQAAAAQGQGLVEMPDSTPMVLSDPGGTGTGAGKRKEPVAVMSGLEDPAIKWAREKLDDTKSAVRLSALTELGRRFKARPEATSLLANILTLSKDLLAKEQASRQEVIKAVGGPESDAGRYLEQRLPNVL
jgi:hypothetical protein